MDWVHKKVRIFCIRAYTTLIHCKGYLCCDDNDGRDTYNIDGYAQQALIVVERQSVENLPMKDCNWVTILIVLSLPHCLTGSGLK